MGAGRRYRSAVSTAASFDDEVGAALAAPVAGWSFDWLTGRAVGAEPSWSYRDLAAPLVAQARALLDIDTGGGEWLASLGAEVGLPVTTFATEGWIPNLSPARLALEPLGVRVLPTPADEVLPAPDAAVDVVLDRHGRLPAIEIARVLQAGGVLLTQQVGSEDCAGLNAALGAPPARRPGSWTAAVAAAEVAAAGMTVDDVREQWPVLRVPRRRRGGVPAADGALADPRLHRRALRPGAAPGPPRHRRRRTPRRPQPPVPHPRPPPVSCTTERGHPHRTPRVIRETPS